MQTCVQRYRRSDGWMKSGPAAASSYSCSLARLFCSRRSPMVQACRAIDMGARSRREGSVVADFLSIRILLSPTPLQSSKPSGERIYFFLFLLFPLRTRDRSAKAEGCGSTGNERMGTTRVSTRRGSLSRETHRRHRTRLDVVSGFEGRSGNRPEHDEWRLGGSTRAQARQHPGRGAHRDGVAERVPLRQVEGGVRIFEPRRSASPSGAFRRPRRIRVAGIGSTCSMATTRRATSVAFALRARHAIRWWRASP